ncbi:hypothetical protein HWV07_00190 [Natronomonas salina]|uniref:DUF5793 family protein n=1 Tax=Natronomonas salina TaxID=1710540 RepID=UPI0015B5B569|nr:DUF5793 family protein [Natronomonas salina]QLD87536.1 hypothetical protein HWV07_00190 [Natronomonas salina]
MRRDYFTLTVDGVAGAGAERPVVTIAYEGPTDQLETQLSKGDSILDDEEIDVAYRLQDALEDDDPTGVVAIADRVTGEYAFELNADADDVFAFIDAAREFGDTSDSEDRYRIVVEADGDRLATYDKSTLLVYDAEGELLRSRSLIPSGVEI